MTHGDIAVVAAQQDLAALGDHIAAAVNAGIDRGLAAAGADGLDFGDGVGQLHQALRTRKEMGLEIRAQSEAEHRKISVVYKIAKLIYLLRREKLTFVRNDNVAIDVIFKFLFYIHLRRDDLRLCGKSYAGADGTFSVTAVCRRLYKPDFHSALLVIELRYKGVCGL